MPPWAYFFGGIQDNSLLLLLLWLVCNLSCFTFLTFHSCPSFLCIYSEGTSLSYTEKKAERVVAQSHSRAAVSLQIEGSRPGASRVLFYLHFVYFKAMYKSVICSTVVGDLNLLLIIFCRCTREVIIITCIMMCLWSWVVCEINHHFLCNLPRFTFVTFHSCPYFLYIYIEGTSLSYTE